MAKLYFYDTFLHIIVDYTLKYPTEQELNDM